MAKLIITRKSEFVNRIRKYSIYLDGDKIGTIGDGETKEFDLAPGDHELKTTLDWCGSRTLRFHLAEGDTRRVETSGFRYNNWLFVFVFVSMIAYSFLESPMRNYVLMLSLVPLAVLAYLFTIGRNDYLYLKAL
ncbi:MAG: hypothetical protein EP344_13900 [Bacteroidetes bacterium]|nr:MAG: hypothetical protein EP344_13900 [Bacteroidota bacterium]